ncbi:MAG: hypothetical protein HY657_02670 [Acidobacteria bacterium]|nr:hypothetical protein [Acidobacteriota bacterium]
MPDLPVVCSLTLAALEARRAGLLASLVRRAERLDPLEDGWRLRFSSEADVLPTIASAVNAERQCCRFLRYTVTVQPDGGPIWLDMQGPPGTRAFLAAMFEE